MSKPLARRQRRVFFTALLLAVAVGILWLAVSMIWHSCRVRLIRVEFLTSGTVRQTVPVTSWLVKKETLLSAPASGRLTLLSGDGERVRIGEAVARIDTPSGVILVRAPAAGVFCTHVDGLETVLRPGTLDALDVDKLEKLQSGTKRPVDGRAVEKGEPVGKLVDNLSPVWLNIQVPANETAKLTRGSSLSLLWQGNILSGQVAEKRESNRSRWLLLPLNNYPDSLIHFRRITADLITGELSGYLVPAQALVKRNGKSGLYIVSRLTVHWVPVQVHGKLADRVAVTGVSLNNNTQVVINPRWAREGDQIQ